LAIHSAGYHISKALVNEQGPTEQNKDTRALKLANDTNIYIFVHIKYNF